MSSDFCAPLSAALGAFCSAALGAFCAAFGAGAIFSAGAADGAFVAGLESCASAKPEPVIKAATAAAIISLFFRVVIMFSFSRGSPVLAR